EQPARAGTDRAGDGAVACDRRLELALEPALELFQIGDRQRLDVEYGRVVVAARPRRPELEPVLRFDRGPAGGPRREEARACGRARPHDVLAVERIEHDHGAPRLGPDEVI